jgi:alkylation response protein AidB-like acyl-CoA dehydrogenase
MADYNAPVKDMLFVLKELAGLDNVCSLPGFEDATDDVVSDILEQAGKFAGGVLAPLNTVGDMQGANCIDNAVQETDGFADAYRQMVDAGWVTLSSNPEFGGMGMPECVGIATTEMWSAANTSFSLCPILSQGATSAIFSHASDELKQAYLPKLVTGEWTGTMNLTEPSAGSDLAAVRTKALPNGDHYVISGTKIFITWGDHQMTDNIVHLVLARTPDAPEGVKGISLFIVPKFLVNDDGSLGKRNDAFAASIEHKMGIHGSPTCVMNFGANEGAVGYLVGQENHGLAYMFTMMNHARLNVGMQGVGLSDQAYQHAVAYAKERVQGLAPGDSDKGTIIRHADIRRMLMLMRSLTEASRAVCYLASAEFDIAHHSDEPEQQRLANARGELLTPIAKGWSTEVSQEVTSLGVQIHGGMGFIEETGAAQFMRDTRITTIYEGTTGIQANDLIGRKLIRDNGAESKRLISEIQSVQQQLETAGDEMAGMAKSLAEGLSSLNTLITWILDNYKSDPRLPSAVAVNLMMAVATVIGGWLLAKSALVAKDKLPEDEKFYGAKIITARFYAQQIMPRTDAYVKAALSGSEMTMVMSEDQF